MGKNAGTGGMTKSEYSAFKRKLSRRHAEFAFTRFVGVAMVLMLTLSLLAGIEDILLHGWAIETFWSVAKFMFWSAFTIYVFTCPGVSHDTLVSELLAAKRCPSCAFDLDSLQADGSGLTRCPECNTQWRIARDRSSA